MKARITLREGHTFIVDIEQIHFDNFEDCANDPTSTIDKIEKIKQ